MLAPLGGRRRGGPLLLAHQGLIASCARRLLFVDGLRGPFFRRRVLRRGLAVTRVVRRLLARPHGARGGDRGHQRHCEKRRRSHALTGLRRISMRRFCAAFGSLGTFGSRSA